MYPISALFADRLRRPDRTFIVKALVNGKNYDNTKIVDFQIENSISLSDSFEIGTAIPSKLTIKLRTSDIIPPNAQIIPYLSLSIADMTWNETKYPWKELAIPWAGGGTDWMPMGEFYVDSREKTNDTWVYTCYDKLVFADVAYISALTYPATQQAVWNEIMSRLGWTSDSTVTINPSYKIQAGPVGYTMRQMMAYIAAANSASVMVGKDGNIKFKRFAPADSPVFAMTGADYVRVKQTNPVKTYSRVVVTYDTDDDLIYEAGTGPDANTLFLENPFMTQAMVNNLQGALNGFSYLPITMDARGYPQLEQGDVFTYEVYEGRTWNDTTVPWNQLDIPWTGMKKHQTLILHQVLSFAGGLKMTLEAPSQSEQQSEFTVDGSLTKAINDLDKNAVKEGKAYYGATLTRTAGLTIEREDRLSKAVFNSDELTFYAGSDKALWFDVQNKKFRFTGTLEGVDGTFSGTIQGGSFVGGSIQIGNNFSVNNAGIMTAAGASFSGNISASTITGGQINGTTITGGLIRSAASGARVETDSTGWRVYDGSGAKRISIAQNNTYGMNAIEFDGSGGGGFINGGDTLFSITSITNMIIAALGGQLTVQGSTVFQNGVTFNSGATGIPISGVTNLQSNLNSLSSSLSGKADTFVTATNMAFDPNTRNLKLFSVTGATLATVNIPAS